MNYIDLVQLFIERSERADVRELEASFREITQTLGFRYFACCSHVDPLRPPRLAVVMHSYPAAWVQQFSERMLYYVDPVFRYAEKTLLPFSWDSSDFQSGLTRQQRELLVEAREHGIEHGFTIPIHLPSSRGSFRASCSVVPDSLSVEPSSYLSVQLMAFYLYEKAVRSAEANEATTLRIELSTRERQCLELVAQGKSDWVIGMLLGISERTVHNHVERVKRRLRVATRVQAIVHALASRQISFGDVVKADPADSRGIDEED